MYLNKVTGIRNDAILKLSIVDADNLSNSSYLVRAHLGNLKSETSQKSGVGPIWNEFLCFDVTDENQQLRIELVDNWGNIILSMNENLREHKEYSEMGHDLWLPRRCRQEEPRLRVRI